MIFFKTYWRILTPARYFSVLAVLLLCFSGIFEGLALLTLIPLLEGNLINNKVIKTLLYNFNLDNFKQQDIFIFSVIIFISLGACSTIFRFLSEGAFLKVRVKIENYTRGAMTKSLLGMNWVDYLSLKVGDISKALLFESYSIGWGGQIFLQGIGNVLIGLVFINIVVLISPKMTLFTLIYCTVGAFVYFLLLKRGKKHSAEMSNAAGKIGEITNEVFGNLKFIKTSGITDRAKKELGKVFSYYGKTYYSSQIYNNWLRFIFETGGVLFIGSFIFYSLIINKATISTVIVILAIFYRLMPKALTIQECFYQANINLSWYETWNGRILYAESRQENLIGTKLPSFKHELVFENVIFRYPNTIKPALNGISIKIVPGECIAIVGSSGSGKSTLLDLIGGIITPEHGKILIDGDPIGDINIKKWRERIGVVLQESPIFHATILENIIWDSQIVDIQKAKQVALAAHALEFINQLEKGFETVVGERGGRLSGGQKQRIALARALYRDPVLLILDEATSALDGDSELMVNIALRELKGKCTMLMVAHSLRSIKIADRIFVIEDGEIIEEGNWENLAQKLDGRFQKIASLQNAIG